MCIVIDAKLARNKEILFHHFMFCSDKHIKQTVRALGMLRRKSK
jgi:hypothetical protein